MSPGTMKEVWNFEEKPLLVFWETTKACLLACAHCRAEAIREGLPGELTTTEGQALIDQMLEFDEPRPILILTGGDLLMRSDIFHLIEYAASKKLRVAVAPSVTPLLTPDVLSSFRKVGVSAMSISLDGGRGETHDGIRGVKGTFDKTIGTLRLAVELGLRVQVNTTVMKRNYRELPDIFRIIRELQVPAWEVFFLVRTGRGAQLEELESSQYEDVMHFLYDASFYGVSIRTTEGPHFRRVVSQRAESVVPDVRNGLYDELVTRLYAFEGLPSSKLKALTTGTRDGKGIIFVAYNGELFPSGFLPLSLGNVRSKTIKQIYQENPTFQALRRKTKLKGKCGQCEYEDVCGGSRARAYALYHDPLQEDPACSYEPLIKAHLES